MWRKGRYGEMGEYGSFEVGPCAGAEVWAGVGRGKVFRGEGGLRVWGKRVEGLLVLWVGWDSADGEGGVRGGSLV